MKRLRCLLLAVVIMTMSLVSNVGVAFADSQRIITLGADLSEEQRSEVLKFFGVSDDDLKSIEVLEITNTDEREVLTGIAPESAIGTKTYSCAYIEPTLSGGIHVKTANLTYVTVSSLYNALQTAGVENCNLIVTAPFEVSGTGALTGVFKAFEKLGNELDKGKQEAAAEELMVGSELESEYGKDGTELVTDLKRAVIDSDKEYSEEELKELAEKEANERGISLTDDELAAITSLLNKIKGLEYDVDAFSQKLSDLSAGLEEKVKESSGVFDAIGRFFKSIGNFFAGLFGDPIESKEDTQDVSSPSIFDNIDTDVYEYDTEGSDEGTIDAGEVSDAGVESVEDVNEIEEVE